MGKGKEKKSVGGARPDYWSQIFSDGFHVCCSMMFFDWGLGLIWDFCGRWARLDASARFKPVHRANFFVSWTYQRYQFSKSDWCRLWHLCRFHCTGWENWHLKGFSQPALLTFCVVVAQGHQGNTMSHHFNYCIGARWMIN